MEFDTEFSTALCIDWMSCPLRYSGSYAVVSTSKANNEDISGNGPQ